MNRRTPGLPFILVTVLLDVMAFGLLLPVLPALVGEFTGSREDQAQWYGAMIVAFGAAQFCCAPFLGALSDRYGRRPVLLLSTAALGTMFLLSALVQSVEALLALRIVGGMLAANYSVANAYVADVTDPAARAKSFGLIGASFGIGYVVGPMVGGLLGHVDVRWPFYAAAALSFANFLYGSFVLPESLAPARRKPAIDLARANPLGALAGLARLRTVGLLVAVIALANLAQFILHGVWVLYTNFRFDWGPRETGLSLFCVGLAVAVVQGGLLRVLLRHLGERRLIIAGLASGTLAYVAYGLATAGWAIYALILANLLAFAVGPALNAIVSRATDPSEQGLAMGALASLGSLMAVLAPLLGTPLLAAGSHYPADDWRVGAPFFLSGALACAALALAALHFARTPAPRGTAADAPHEASFGRH